jgi:hypothetical protein
MRAKLKDVVAEFHSWSKIRIFPAPKGGKNWESWGSEKLRVKSEKSAAQLQRHLSAALTHFSLIVFHFSLFAPKGCWECPVHFFESLVECPAIGKASLQRDFR